MPSDRILVTAAGVCGAAGVALSAAAAHLGGAHLGTAASFLLANAPAILAIGLIGNTRTLRLAGYILLIGVVLFSADLASLDLLGRRPFPYAAPIGGTLTIIGWLVVAASALFRSNRSA
ncbi:MAG TPA: DUF423 domain-containing protein [Rhizobiaceae bacterium]|jgi:uncharacterized membrane protein YgdD (TMEM256/DUF423 family)|nr:DUF423 domain-containing protein [Rhizobiaceae bacterium]